MTILREEDTDKPMLAQQHEENTSNQILKGHQLNHITCDDWEQSHNRDSSPHNAKEYIILAMLENTLTHMK